MNQYVKAALDAAMDAAIQADHPCADDVGCDIEVARSNGFIVASAILLQGATETPALGEVLTRYKFSLPDLHSRPFSRWVAWHRKNGHECPDCESFMYAELPVQCTNCLHLITAENELKENYS